MTILRPTFVSLLLFSLLFGAAYPMFTTGMAKALFPHEAQGSLITDKSGAPLGSELIGQNFTGPHYFWGRLSATGPVPYNAAASSGSTLGPVNQTLLDNSSTRVAALGGSAPVPADLATASGSGLDPHISIEAAEYQMERVAKARGGSVEQLRPWVAKYTEGRQFGILGEPRVNVLKLNLALDGKL